MRVRIGTLQPGTSLPLTTPILVSQRFLHQSLRLQLLRHRMARTESRVHQHPRVSLEPQFFLLAILRATAKGKARVVEDRDHLLPKIPPRPFVTSISTKGIANMVTSANTAILNTIGIGGRTKVAGARVADRLLQEGHRLLVERRTATATGG